MIRITISFLILMFCVSWKNKEQLLLHNFTQDTLIIKDTIWHPDLNIKKRKINTGISFDKENETVIKRETFYINEPVETKEDSIDLIITQRINNLAKRQERIEKTNLEIKEEKEYIKNISISIENRKKKIEKLEKDKSKYILNKSKYDKIFKYEELEEDIKKINKKLDKIAKIGSTNITLNSEKKVKEKKQKDLNIKYTKKERRKEKRRLKKYLKKNELKEIQKNIGDEKDYLKNNEDEKKVAETKVKNLKNYRKELYSKIEKDIKTYKVTYNFNRLMNELNSLRTRLKNLILEKIKIPKNRKKCEALRNKLLKTTQGIQEAIKKGSERNYYKELFFLSRDIFTLKDEINIYTF